MLVDPWDAPNAKSPNPGRYRSPIAIASWFLTVAWGRDGPNFLRKRPIYGTRQKGVPRFGTWANTTNVLKREPTWPEGQLWSNLPGADGVLGVGDARDGSQQAKTVYVPGIPGP